MTDPMCLARPHADQQIRCAVCRLVWDIDDPNPPTCGKLPKVVSPPLIPTAPKYQREPFVSGMPTRWR